MTAAAVADRTLYSGPEVARLAGVRPQQVARWLKGVRVGGRTVRLKATTCYGSRVRVSAEDLAEFERQCRQAKFGDATAETVPEESPAQRTRRCREAKERLSKMLEN